MTTYNYPGANIYKSGAQGAAVGSIPAKSGSTVAKSQSTMTNKKIVIRPTRKTGLAK